MLVLSRHENEQIRIGHDITITVVEIRGDKVRIGISAPASVPVHRSEVYDLQAAAGGVKSNAVDVDELRNCVQEEQAP